MSDPPQISEVPAKKPQGFQKGVSGNPKGRPAAGVQGFKDRLAWWLETKTIGDIRKIIENPKKWDKLVSVDAMVARRIHQACQKDGNGDFMAILDRLLGKPAMTAEVSVTHGLADRLNKAEAILLENNPSALIAATPLTIDHPVHVVVTGDDDA